MTPLATVAWLDGLLSEHRIAYWIFGGFAVDFHVAEKTRSHDDVDVAVLHEDFSRAEELFVAEGWIRLQGGEGYVTLEREGARIDLAPVARDDVGWPAGAFGDDMLELDGVRARVVSRAALMADKAEVREDASTRAKDAADLRRLARDQLFLLKPNFEDPAYPGKRFYCWHCALMEGIVASFPELAARIDIRRIEWPRPRTELVALVGEENQSLPVLVLPAGDTSPHQTGVHRGRPFISVKDDILTALTERHGFPLPHP